MSHAYAYCVDCHEMTFGVMDQANGFRANAGTNTHWDHAVTPFEDITALPRPIFNLITRLGASLPLSDTAITMFRLGLDLHNYPTGALEATCQPAQSTALAAVNTSVTSDANVQQLDASTKYQPASVPTRRTRAESQPSLFDEVNNV